MLLKDGANSASKFAPHLISNEEAEQFDLSLLSKVILVTCLCSPRWLSTPLKVFLHFIFDNLVSRQLGLLALRSQDFCWTDWWMLGTITFECFHAGKYQFLYSQIFLLCKSNINSYSGYIFLMLANIYSYAGHCLFLCWEIFMFKVQAVPAQPHGQHGGGTSIFSKVRFWVTSRRLIYFLVIPLLREEIMGGGKITFQQKELLQVKEKSFCAERWHI